MQHNFHETLNKKLWEGFDLKPEVSKKLKEIARAFIEFLDIPKDSIKDIVITGSCASYNYTPYSDIDLHLLVDFDKVHDDCPIVGDFLLSKKSEFNNNHDIYIYGIPVEVYAESYKNENVHNGLYSLKFDKWLEKPEKIKPLDNDLAIEAKLKELKEAIKEVNDKEKAIVLIDKIKKMRKAGLADKGEFSVENQVFKRLRNEGIIGKLMDIKKEGIDKELSLEEAYQNIFDFLNEGGISVGKWSRSAANSLDKRKEKLENLRKQADYVKRNTSTDVTGYLKPDRELTKKGTKRKRIDFTRDIDYDAYNKAMSNLDKLKKDILNAERKVAHAEEVNKLNLPKNSKVSAKKLTNAARGSWSDRFHKNQENLNKTGEGAARTSFKRVLRAQNIRNADPNVTVKGKKEEAVRKALNSLNLPNETEDKKVAVPNEPKQVYYNQGDREHLEDMYNRVRGLSKQAKEEQENAQITQGLRNKLEKIYNKNESLGTLCESLLGYVEEMLGMGGSTALMAPYPTPVVGQVSLTRVNRKVRKDLPIKKFQTQKFVK